MNYENIEILKKLFSQLKLDIEIKLCKKENSFFIFDLILNPGTTFRKLEKYSTEIALTLKAVSNPLIYPVTKEGIVRMEVMVSEQDTVLFNSISKVARSSHKLPLFLGSCRKGNPIVIDLTEMPHMLVSGTTGSGKSVLLHSIINSLLINERNIEFALIDTKRVEFSNYSNLSKLYGPIAKDVESSVKLLEDLVKEMEERFVYLEKHNYRNIYDCEKKMPFIVVVIDELADLMIASKKAVQILICRLAQKSRACGIHIVMATQRPSVDVVTGLIKANFPARISCQVSTIADSRTILDKSGAEKLTGKGDAIIDCSGYEFKRFKGAFLTESDIISNVRKKQNWWNRIWDF
jgi:S-DNA-T family DNA segregation ATPase FtsK/SpoIIIE